jgi:diguanylate cyclase (GGDEF)-like protein
MNTGTKVTLIIYLFSQVLVLAILIYRNHVQRRLNYLQQLQLETLAKTDVLTKAFNRVACDMSLDQMCASHRDFSLILVDIDDFKQINDTCGHLTGDKVIVKIVEIIKAIVRQDDIVARWGGEEFIVILPYTSLDRAAGTANRIKKHLSAIEYGNTTGKVTASFGVTAFIEGDDMNSIVNRADQLLYEAKQQGKNNVVFG